MVLPEPALGEAEDHSENERCSKVVTILSPPCKQ